jgi:hypothetical protein
MDFLTDMLTDWPLGTILGSIMVICVLILVIFLLGMLFTAIDSWGLPEKSEAGIIIDREFTPAHFTTILMYSPATKTSLPQTIHHPDDWSVSVAVNHGQQGWVSIEKELFDSISNGDRVTAWLVRGRISGEVYIKSIEH